jgi:hypothetical protein
MRAMLQENRFAREQIASKLARGQVASESNPIPGGGGGRRNLVVDEDEGVVRVLPGVILVLLAWRSGARRVEDDRQRMQAS